MYSVLPSSHEFWRLNKFNLKVIMHAQKVPLPAEPSHQSQVFVIGYFQSTQLGCGENPNDNFLKKAYPSKAFENQHSVKYKLRNGTF